MVRQPGGRLKEIPRYDDDDPLDQLKQSELQLRAFRLRPSGLGLEWV